MSVAPLRLAPVGEAMFPPRAPFFFKLASALRAEDSVWGTSRFPPSPSPPRHQVAVSAAASVTSAISRATSTMSRFALKTRS
jgi:hypothetical protein